MAEKEMEFCTVEEILEATEKAVPYVDIPYCGKYIRVNLAPTYDDILELDKRQSELLSSIQSAKCPKHLIPFKGYSEESIRAAGLLAFQGAKPTFTLEQAFKVTRDGLSTKLILSAIQTAGASHLIAAIKARIDEGKKDSSESPVTE